MTRRPPAHQILENLLERATSAHRERDAAGRLQPSPAWADLDTAGRLDLFRRQAASRKLERAADPDGLSTTCRAVLSRLRHLPQFPADPED